MQTRGLTCQEDKVLERSWSWGDPAMTCAIDIPVRDGHEILHCEAMDDEAFRAYAEALHLWKRDDVATLHADLPWQAVPALGIALPDWLHVYQPGFRRICRRPTDDWLKQEAHARRMANAKIAQGHSPESLRRLFAHLPDNAEFAGRMKELKQQGVLVHVPLCRFASDGRGHEFPWHEVLHVFS